MATYYSLMPQKDKDSKEVAASPPALNQLRATCENVEIETCNSKLNEAQTTSYHFQLLVYLVQDELNLAKYLVKRVPKEVAEKDTFKAIWDVGCSMFANDHPAVYDKLRKGKWLPIYAPFMKRVEMNYRLKQVKLVSKAYTSISIKELLGFYLGYKDIKELVDFIKQNNLSDTWTLDSHDKPQKVVIKKQQEDYQSLLNAQRLMAQFTKYVVFMESQQKLAVDEISSASSKN